MTFNEIDVVEVLEGFPPSPFMSKASRVEVVRRLDERAARRGDDLPSRPWLAEALRVSTRTIERYRRELRDGTLS